MQMVLDGHSQLGLTKNFVSTLTTRNPIYAPILEFPASAEERSAKFDRSESDEPSHESRAKAEMPATPPCQKSVAMKSSEGSKSESSKYASDSSAEIL